MIKFADVSIKDSEIQNTVKDILESGRFIQGPYVEQFSQAWANKCGVFHCIPVASGMAALISVLKAIKEVSNNNFVVVPQMTFAATAFAVLEANCIPIFCSVDSNGLLNQEECLDIIRRREVLAVIPVHLYGQYMKIEEEILDKTYVIEDACQCHGALQNIQGLAACFSFYPSKNLGAAGDAGAIITNHTSIADRITKYVSYGDPPKKKYIHEITGNNLRMDEIQAAILLKKLPSLDSNNQKRIELAQRYVLEGVSTFARVKPNVFHLYPILVDDPINFIDLFNQSRIEVGRHYPYRMSDVCRGLDRSWKGEDFSEKIAQHVLTLPIGPHLTQENVERVCSLLKSKARLENHMWRLK